MTEINYEVIFKTLPDKPLLRIDEVAKFLNLSKRTTYRLYPDQIQGVQINGITLIYRQSIIDLVSRNNGKKKDDETPEEIEQKIKSTKEKKKIINSRSGWVKNY